MDNGSNRVEQVFIWKQGQAPDLTYARQVLTVVNPDASRAVAGDNPPLHLFAASGPWPEDFWTRALSDMRTVPGAQTARWTDLSRHTLSGWQGTDSRTGDKIFVVTVLSKGTEAGSGAEAAPQTFKGEGVQGPPYMTQPLSQGAYYPPYTTSPLGWPAQPPSGYSYPPYQGAPPGIYGQATVYPNTYNPLTTGPLVPVTPSLPMLVGGTNQPEGVPVALPDSYAPFYAGFGERLAASLIDFFFLSWGEALIVGLAFFVLSGRRTEAADLAGWLGAYGPFVCLGWLVFVAYEIIGWGAYGRTFGKKLMGIQVVRADGSVPGFGRAMLRMLGYIFSASIAFLGFLLIAFDVRRQGLHDKMAETYVVPEKPAVPPPPGLPGYKVSLAALPAPSPQAPVRTPGAQPAGAVGMAAVSPVQPYERVNVSRTPGAQQEAARTESLAPTRHPSTGNIEGRSSGADGETTPQAPTNGSAAPSTTGPINPLGPATEALLEQTLRERPERHPDVARARSLYKSGLEQLERGVRQGFGNMDVDAVAARRAATLFRDALDIIPTAVAYKYFYAVALRYSEGFDVAISEFRQVIELDPGHYEAQQQVALGPRWHDPFAYPSWGEPTPIGTGEPLPDPVRLLLPKPNRPGTRLVLLREGGNKMVVALSRTRRDTWAKFPTIDMPARIELVLTRTPHGPVIAFYVVIKDDPENPYKGETFLNPHDPGNPSDDACQLGQHMLAQLARQDHTFLIFVDENDNLMLSRKLVFDTPTQVNITRVHYEVQTLPAMIMDAARFTQAAQWHMDNFSLDQIK